MPVDNEERHGPKESDAFEETTEVIITGEQLRLRMHQSVRELIKDRRYHFRTYTTCFVGNEAVDWLLEQREVDDRKTAVCLMRVLQEHNVLHHVCNDHAFKDEALFYRFRRDDGTFPKYNEARLFYRGRQLFERLGKEGRLTKRSIGGVDWDYCITGKDIVDWILKVEGKARELSRTYVVKECQELVNFRVIQSGSELVQFEDDDSAYYIFPLRLTKTRSLSDLKKHVRSRTRNYFDNCQAGAEQSINPGMGHACPLCEHKSSQPNGPSARTHSKSEHAMQGQKIKSVQFRNVTPEELEDPHSYFVKTNVNIFSDSVGYGFVVRGDSPTYVQTVDPQGPAAAAGVKVRQFIMSVNGQNVLRLNHKEVARLILQDQDSVTLVVLSHFREASK